MKETKKAYKGFNSDMTCRGFQYEVGKEYECEGGVALCSNGFHACENPLDVLDHYDNVDGKYCEVEQYGEIVSDNRKTASSRIKINAEIGFVGLFKEGVEWLKELTNPQKIIKADKHSSGNSAKIGSSGDSAQIGSSGDYAKIGSSGNSAKIGSSGYSAKIGSSGYSAKIGSSGNSAQIGSSGNSAQIGSSGDSAKIGSSGDYAQIGSSGDYAKIGSSGDYAKIGSSGNSAQIGSTGEDSVICCAGEDSIVKAKLGSWITLSEWRYDEKKGRRVPVYVKTEQVDGIRIKADTWYKLENGEFTEANK